MEKDKKKIILISIGVILLITLVVGLSYAMYTFTGSGTKENVIQTGHIVITFNDVNNISIQNRYPETDSEGLANTDTNSQMTFTVTSDITGSTKVNYALGITDIQEGATLTQKNIKIYLKKGNNVAAGFTENKGELISSFKPLYIENVMTSHVLLTDVISGSEVHTYTLKAWIDENYKLPSTESNTNGIHTSNTTSETFTFKIKGYGTTESIEVKRPTLNQLILGANNSNVLNTTATLTDTYSNAGDASGLYKSIDGETNSGTTYFYRGDVTNNYVSFANMLWRIVRINEDGSIRILLQDGINNNTTYQFNPTGNEYTYMYYSNSDVDNGIKRTVDTWYNDNLKTYENYAADTEFCEQYKVSWSTSGYTAGNETVVAIENYTSNFKCSTDGNGKGIITTKVGLLTYDEAVHAGNHYSKPSNSYITNGNNYWLMSPAGASNYGHTNASAWEVSSKGYISSVSVDINVNYTLYAVRPVISLKADTIATGSGTSDDPYIVQTN